MSENVPAKFSDSAVDRDNRDNGASTGSPYARLYEELLQDLDSPFAEFLKKLHGVCGALKVGHPFGSSMHSIMSEADAAEALQMLTTDNQHPRFKDNWARALTYRYRPLKEATRANRTDDTLKEVIQKAEEWINVLYDAISNVTDVNNKSTSVELNMFKSATLDMKAVEAACRAILVALIHRCLVGYCGIRISSSAYASRQDKRLTCKDRLLAVINALKYDKRICKDVLTDDSKINFLVHAPMAVLKCKKTQEKGNDVKRDLLAEAAAARRQVLVSSATPAAVPVGSESTSSTPGLISEDELPARKGLNLPQPSFDKDLNTSVGSTALNAEHFSKKRTCSDMQSGDNDMEGGKRTRVKMDAVNMQGEKDNIVVEAEPAQN